MSQPHEKPPWKRFDDTKKVLTLSTSKDCPRKGPGCKISKAHGCLNDAEAYLRKAIGEMEPRTEEAHMDVDEIRELADLLLRLEKTHRDLLLKMGTSCNDAEWCRNL